MKGCHFGLEKINNRYSVPNNLKGNKLSFENMNRTMKLKYKKVEEINTSRSEMEMYNLHKEEGEEEIKEK